MGLRREKAWEGAVKVSLASSRAGFLYLGTTGILGQITEQGVGRGQLSCTG